MNFRTGDMFDHLKDYDFVLVTTNSFVRKDGNLVMGRGAAYTASQLDPRTPRVYGQAITSMGKHMGVYGLLHNYNSDFGLFQVKRHWSDDASTRLITYSAQCLAFHAEESQAARWALNYPGIGNGRLTRDLIDPILSRFLGDLSNVDVWTFN